MRMARHRPRLDVRDLEVILALAEAGSTTKAAASLHLTQSAVSRALGLAEEKLGARVFERGAHGLTPTSAGKRLLAGAGRVLEALEALERDALGEARRTQLRIVCECYTAYRWLPTALARARREMPELDVSIAVDQTSTPVEALRDGKIDVALLTTGSTRGLGDAFEERPLFSDEVVFVVSTTHPLAARRAITARDLCEHPLVTSNTPPEEARWFANAVFGRKRPKVSFLTFPLTEAIVDAARAGMGIAVLSEWIAESYLDGGGIVAKRLAQGPLRRPWRIAYRRDARDAAMQLASLLERAPPALGAVDPRRRRSA